MRTSVREIEQLQIGQNVEIDTVFDDKTTHTFHGQVSDIEPQQEVVKVVDAANGEIKTLYWGASDEEERTWYILTEDDIPLTVEQRIGLAAIQYRDQRDELIASYEVRKLRSQLRHEKQLDKLSAAYRDSISNLEFLQLDEDTDLFEDEQD